MTNNHLLYLFIFSFLLNTTNDPSNDLVSEQKKIIGELTGKTEILDGKRLISRSNKKERQLTRTYLAEIITDLGIQPQFHAYSMPNIHPLIDLIFDPFKGANVYGVLEATQESDEYIVLGAHFDTERKCPGAIDNGVGVALVYSVIKKLTQLENRKRNVIFIFFDQEEEELNGSRAFGTFLLQEGFNVHSVHTVDAIGWDSDGDRAIEIELPDESIKPIYQAVGQTLNIPIHTTKVNGSDHAAFRALGFKVTGITCEYANGDYTPFKDTSEDTFETVNFEYLASSTHLVYTVFKNLCEQ